ncbi:GNAT family N-acetyltransferase [Deinococcus sp. KNUC1210]|uniref:GNAT family N-acetyltransferase n=1 Tax=Deinococcus sp. KNUC1210 TaxID=2917691 RepID=UPI001EF07263|nr:GNAT family N-acetyltransferase [Deinococcus sp. KNUC1210]ULH15162.1 GNAT family N-acetyltransferase [Deinococcus sp. KNUC1210]
MSTTVRVLQSTEAHILSNVAPDVFDGPVHPEYTAEFFADSRHHLAVALDGEMVVGMASGVRYMHPDKAPELFINEVGVSPDYQGQGLGRRMLDALIAHAKALGCVAAWVLTEEENAVARRLYASVGGMEAECRIFVVPLEES